MFTSQCSLSTFAHALGGMTSLLPSMNNLFRGISFSQEDKIHEHIQVSLLLGRRTKGKFAACFCRLSKGLSAENLVFRREEMTD